MYGLERTWHRQQWSWLRDTDLEPHRRPVEDHVRSGTYLAPSTVVVVERGMNDGVPASIPTTSNAIQMMSAPSSPTPPSRNTEHQSGVRRNGRHQGQETRKFVTKFNFRLQRIGHNKKLFDHPRSAGVHNAQKRERKATKTLAIVLGESQSTYCH